MINYPNLSGAQPVYGMQPINIVQSIVPTKATQISVHFRASNKKYVCAEGGGGKEIKANRGSAKGWETFKLILLENDRLCHGGKVAISCEKGEFLSVVGSKLMCNKKSYMASEIFTLIHPSGIGEIYSKNWICLQTFEGKYVGYEKEGETLVCSNIITPKEMFKIKIVQ